MTNSCHLKVILTILILINYSNCTLIDISLSKLQFEFSCALEITNKLNPKIIFIKDKYNMISLYSKIHKNYIMQFIYMKNLPKFEYCPKIEQYVFIDYSVEQLIEILSHHLTEVCSWNPRALFIFIFSNNPQKNIWKLIFKCWNFDH